jgi:hypothetical protein
MQVLRRFLFAAMMKMLGIVPKIQARVSSLCQSGKRSPLFQTFSVCFAFGGCFADFGRL